MTPARHIHYRNDMETSRLILTAGGHSWQLPSPGPLPLEERSAREKGRAKHCVVLQEDTELLLSKYCIAALSAVTGCGPQPPPSQHHANIRTVSLAGRRRRNEAENCKRQAEDCSCQD